MQKQREAEDVQWTISRSTLRLPQGEGEEEGRGSGREGGGAGGCTSREGGSESSRCQHGQTRVLNWAARSESPTGRREYRVGQYVVDLLSFEQLALPVLKNADAGPSPGKRVCIIDEIGKMELFSQTFIHAVRQTLSSPGTVILGTIPIPKGKPLTLVEEIRNRNDVKVLNVTKENRDSLLQEIVTAVQNCRK
ncbi:cancer-related nucleoside-triphosphatase isoform X3 [Petaurus breviceps papuanus]|uniref:cancer-related nucleoside-triphosphatase isoform X3 n=1 Tax=Petaurus breviceps papuanus TaxID=3040969 RepID=UPI0036DA36E6